MPYDGFHIFAKYRRPENSAFYRLAPGTYCTILKFPRGAMALVTQGGAP